MNRIRAAILALTGCAGFGLALAFSACIQIGPSSDDDSADAAPPTVEAQCSEVMVAFCSRANACYGEDENACFDPNVQTCCDNACGKPATSTEKAIQLCVADMASADCDDIVKGQLPSRCQGVVTH